MERSGKHIQFSILLYREGTSANSFEHTRKPQLRKFHYDRRDMMRRKEQKSREGEAEEKMELKGKRRIKNATIPKQKRCRGVREVVLEGISWKKNYTYQQ